MKVLLIAESFPPRLNSGARLFSELAADLVREGFEVSVLSVVPDRYLAGSGETELRGMFPYREDDGVRVRMVRALPFARANIVFRAFDQLFTAGAFLLLGLLMGRHGAVIVYSPPFPLNLVGYVLARLWRGRLIVNAQDQYPETPAMLGLMKNRMVLRIVERLARSLYRRSDAVTVHSEGNARFIREKYAPDGRLHVVHNWVDTAAGASDAEAAEYRKRHGMEDAFVVSYAGVMGYGQGIEDLIEAAERLHGEGRLLLAIAGEGILLPRVQQRVREKSLDNVLLLPTQSAEDYHRLLAASDVGVVTLKKELRLPVVPGKLQSIMAAGRAALCSVPRESDVWPILAETRCGIGVEAGNVEQLVEAIRRLAADPDETREMGRRGRAYAEEVYDRQRCTARYVEILRGFAE